MRVQEETYREETAMNTYGSSC